MADGKPALEEVTGYLGVGSLEMLGIFFALDGISGFLSFIEIYAKTSAWAILVTVPILVVSYVTGLCSSFAAQWFVHKLRGNLLTPEQFAFVSTSKNEPLIQRYAETERNSRLLYGCSIAFIFVGVGSALEVRMMAQFGFVGYLGLIGGLLLASACLFLARELQREIAKFIEAVREINTNLAAYNSVSASLY